MDTEIVVQSVKKAEQGDANNRNKSQEKKTAIGEPVDTPPNSVKAPALQSALKSPRASITRSPQQSSLKSPRVSITPPQSSPKTSSPHASVKIEVAIESETELPAIPPGYTSFGMPRGATGSRYANAGSRHGSFESGHGSVGSRRASIRSGRSVSLRTPPPSLMMHATRPKAASIASNYSSPRSRGASAASGKATPLEGSEEWIKRVVSVRIESLPKDKPRVGGSVESDTIEIVVHAPETVIPGISYQEMKEVEEDEEEEKQKTEEVEEEGRTEHVEEEDRTENVEEEDRTQNVEEERTESVEEEEERSVDVEKDAERGEDEEEEGEEGGQEDRTDARKISEKHVFDADLWYELLARSSLMGDKAKASVDVASLASFRHSVFHPRFREASLDVSLTASLETYKADLPESTSPPSPVSSVGVTVEEEEEPEIDRHLYKELHALYTSQQAIEKDRHSKLETQIVNYYRKRRMYSVLYSDLVILPEQQKKYDKLLEDFDAVVENSAREQADLEGYVESLKRKCADKKRNLEELFNTLQKKEHDLCREIATKTGLKTFEKFDELYLRRQRAQFNCIGSMRLTYLKLRNRVENVRENLKSVEYIGENLRATDYADLKIENRALTDRLEERRQELIAIRAECKNTVQTLAHFREMVAFKEVDIKEMTSQMDNVIEERLEIREQLLALKSTRDRYRKAIVDLKNSGGLVAKPKHLKDLQATMNELTIGNLQLQQYVLEDKMKTVKLNSMRQMINQLVMEQRQRSSLELV